MGGMIAFVRVRPDASLLYYGFFDPVLVCLSIAIAIFGSYSALLVIERSAGGGRLARRVWRSAAGLCMGAGVWAMHFVGMLAFSLPCSTSYEPTLTALSIVPATLASILAVAMISHRKVSSEKVTLAGLLLGLGIGAMHFSGMAAMRLAGSIRYDPLLFALSIAVAVLLAVLALWLRTMLSSLPRRWSRWATPISAVIIGLAVSGMHYTAMAAAYFVRDESQAAATALMAPGFLALVTLVVSAAVIIFNLVAFFLAKPAMGRSAVPYRGVAIAMILWSVLSWLVTDYYTGQREASAYRKGMETAQQRVEAVALNAENDIALLGGIAALISKSEEMRALILKMNGAPPAAADDAAERKREWTANPVLADTSRLLANVVTNLGADVVYLLNARGDCLAASNFDDAASFVGANFADRDYFRQAYAGRTGLQYAFGRVSKVGGLFTSHPIIVQDRFLGAVIVKRNVSDFVRWTRQTNAFIADDNGVIFLSEDPRLLFRLLPGAKAMQRPADLLEQQYGRNSFAPAEFLPWKNGAFPGLVSIGKQGDPLGVASKDIMDGALRISVPLPVPEITRIEAERWWLFLLLALPGTTLIAAVTTFVAHLRAARRAEDELKHAARIDFLTGLANRASLTEFLGRQLAEGRAGALLFIDLERFKEINDSQGYMAGDALLKAVAERLSAVLRAGELLGRIGGDEFALIVPEADEDKAIGVARRLQQALAEPITHADFTSSIGAKIGVALYPAERNTADEVFADAGLASRMSGAGVGGASFYAPHMSAVLSERLEIARRLKLALSEGLLQLHYQPKFEMRAGRLSGAEALLRWDDPVLGTVSPDLFVAIAEERGLMPALGRWVVEEACRQLSAWRAQGLALPGRLAINVSALQFDSPDFVASVTGLVKAAGHAPTDFELEITESTLMSDGPAAVAMMKDLIGEGFACAIDDFGTGFSSLAYLSQFPAVTLKIDKSFVHSMLSSPTDLVIVETVLGMAKSLGLAVVAEGVETEQQADALVKLGCGLAQGYHYGRPEPPERFAEFRLKAAE